MINQNHNIFRSDSSLETSSGGCAPGCRAVYSFGVSGADGNAGLRKLLGGKGAGLSDMARLGLPIPSGFTITTEACRYYYRHDGELPPLLYSDIENALYGIELDMERGFGSSENPLLLSCRSGAPQSMPGMMDTILNIGLNDTTVHALARITGDSRFAWDCYRRFIQMYATVVMGVKTNSRDGRDLFEVLLEAKKRTYNEYRDSNLPTPALKELVSDYRELVRTATGEDVPEDPMAQLRRSIKRVFDSWMNDRARVYRRTYGLSDDMGTAVTVQAMVFGNLGEDCATGVALTRDVATGAPGLNGDFLINAQGEDVVAGTRTPLRIEKMLSWFMPRAYRELKAIASRLEKHYRDVQDIEFTIEQDKVWILQTRAAKRSGHAAVRIAVDLVSEGMITEDEAMDPGRIPADDLNQLLQPIFDPKARKQAVAEDRLLVRGIPAGPGAACGTACFSPAKAEEILATNPKAKVILIRHDTDPEDLRGMKAASGILTATGGASSHAALVSRQLGKVCVVGCSSLNFEYSRDVIGAGSHEIREGDTVAVDGFTGEVFAGSIKTISSSVMQALNGNIEAASRSEVYKRYKKLMGWADKKRKLKVRTNADKPMQARQAVSVGAEGIGLCRTEHMFFDRIDDFRAMLLASGSTARQRALEKILLHQRRDFRDLFKIMRGKPVTIRLLDPPLHEFLPKTREEQAALADRLDLSPDYIRQRVEELQEFNPMLGHRGCRVGIVYPEIPRMQARAIFEAACDVREENIANHIEIMIPLVAFSAEFNDQQKIIREEARRIMAERGIHIDYLVGTMVELPRGAVCAGGIAKDAEFFSFGTNDLTQTTLGMSRDDYGRYIEYYKEHDIIPNDPFQTIDREGVGKLISMAVKEGRRVRPNIELGICGEHGGDPKSVAFCHSLGLDYVSCSPLRVPVARLAAAQAEIANPLESN